MTDSGVNTEQLVRVKEACNILQINRNTFYEIVKRKQIQVVDLNKGLTKRPRYRVKISSIMDYINNQTVKN